MDGLAVEHYTRTPPLASTESNMAAVLPPPHPSPREPSEKRELPHHPMLSTADLLNPIIEKPATPPLVEEPVPLHPQRQSLPPLHHPHSHPYPHPHSHSHSPSLAHSHIHNHSHSHSPVENGARATITPPREPTNNGPAIADVPK
ncbi:hypothetical protein TARUN_9681 [Trichoderma arundinaceum]|uniref:Uncharacterized protein n=1 Tax=Trichoderma arundinaceum TaxID=490622 RepID=A0A395N8W7_TRIAR|nr:hypothetical protein TARUN_9681 [Trichoderma arundinaceum]